MARKQRPPERSPLSARSGVPAGKDPHASLSTDLYSPAFSVPATPPGAERSLPVSLEELDRLMRERTWELAVAKEELDVERKRLLALLDQLPGFVCLLAPDYTIRFANQTFHRLFGDPGGGKCYQIMRGRQSSCADCTMDQVLRHREMMVQEWTHSLLIAVSNLVGQVDLIIEMESADSALG